MEFNIDFMGNNTQSMIDRCNEEISFTTDKVLNDYIDMLEEEIKVGVSIFTDFKTMNKQEIDIKIGYVRGIIHCYKFYTAELLKNVIKFKPYEQFQDRLYLQIKRYREYKNMSEEQKKNI